MLQKVRLDMAGDQYAVPWKLRWQVWTVYATQAAASEAFSGVRYILKRMQDESEPRLWPEHAGLAESGQCAVGDHRLRYVDTSIPPTWYWSS